jgi:hypothetical protein
MYMYTRDDVAALRCRGCLPMRLLLEKLHVSWKDVSAYEQMSQGTEQRRW